MKICTEQVDVKTCTGETTESLAYKMTEHLMSDSPLQGADYDAGFQAKFFECLNTVRGKKPMTPEQREIRDRERDMRNAEKLNERRNRRYR